MGKDNKSTFIHELKLITSPEDSKALGKRLDVARQLYNACLGESLRRLSLMRESKLYQNAVKMPKQVKDKKGNLISNKDRAKIFKQIRERYQFSEYGIHAYLTKIYSKTWLSQHVDSLTAQKVATRAFKAVEAYAYGQKGRPRFKGKNQLSSIEGKNNKSGIRFVDGKVIWSAGRKKVVLRPKYDIQDKDSLEAYALSCKTKYVRIVRRILKGNTVWYAQLIQDGMSYVKAKHKVQEGIVGLDIGPSSIAIVNTREASLQAFCMEVADTRNKISVIQKKMSRSLRLNNPNNYEDDRVIINTNNNKFLKLGKVKKGPKKWFKSNRYTALQKSCLELQRKMVASRKASHSNMVNKILSLGSTVKTEKLSYKSFQKMFGRSVGFRAPGLFLEILRRKAERAGGKVIEFNTRTTALSQVCQCGNKKKKALKERWHTCESCGILAQRDLYSAYLAQYVEDNRLDTSQAKLSWASADILLEQAVSSLNKTATSKICLASFGLGQSQSGLLVKKESVPNEALDVVT